MYPVIGLEGNCDSVAFEAAWRATPQTRMIVREHKALSGVALRSLCVQHHLFERSQMARRTSTVGVARHTVNLDGMWHEALQGSIVLFKSVRRAEEAEPLVPPTSGAWRRRRDNGGRERIMIQTATMEGLFIPPIRAADHIGKARRPGVPQAAQIKGPINALIVPERPNHIAQPMLDSHPRVKMLEAMDSRQPEALWLFEWQTNNGQAGYCPSQVESALRMNAVVRS
ncbi:hypothetical protein OE88DRAFT_1640409 [Heliocybe sulcata]|uniref:Uncharacterized protein n=1 Tax=Heliocybe sulcata TaxID=5364 RepID=A0A5C3NFE7_9AGAM|nr:hypothetical protein OE88DRAFT_1640409 [Heliocybe sulcata]